jgi:hypothetical protein
MIRTPLSAGVGLLLIGALTGCPVVEDEYVDGATSDQRAIVTHAPFGGDTTLASVDRTGYGVSDGLLGLPGSDWLLTVADGDPWLLGRFFLDTVRRYDGLDFSAPTLEFSTGAGTNPHALAVCGDRIYVTRYDLTEDQTAGGDVAMYSLTTGAPLGTVDLSPWNPHADGTPEPDAMVLSDGSLYVALQRFDRDDSWTPHPAGVLVEIDCATGAVLEAREVATNPRLSAVPGDAGTLQIGHDRGVDHLDLATGTITEVVVDADLGADVVSLGLAVSGDHALLVVEVDGFTNELWCLDLAAGTRTMLGAVDHRNWGLQTAPDGLVWALWRDHWATDSVVEEGGIAIYDPAACAEVTSDWITFGSDPYTLTFYDGR